VTEAAALKFSPFMSLTVQRNA